jgi:hypothetical protein
MATARVSGLTAATFSAIATPGPVDTVTVDARTKVLVGGTAQVTARLADRYGNLVTGRTVAWTISGAQVASVSASGVVTGVRAGQTTVVARVEERLGSGLVGVVAPLGFGTASIDGVLASGEWANAASFAIDVVLPEGGTTPGTLYVMNDASNLYLAVRYARSIDDQAKGVVFEFDNNGSGLFGYPPFEEGDDALVLNAPSQLFDDYRTYRPPCPPETVCAPSDTDDGGRVDGSGAYAREGTLHVFEIAHPLRSGDTAHDFSLNAGEDVGLQLHIVIIAGGGEHPPNSAGTGWPNGAYLYVRIASAP